jgi:hypothetical protein
MMQGPEAVGYRVHRPSGSNGDLIYLTTTRGIIIASYAQGRVVGSISWYSRGNYICSDPTNGNVFIREGDTIYEYAHGAVSPMATLTLSGYYITGGCSVDPTTGNLAQAAVSQGRDPKAVVLVYSGGQGAPTPYADKRIQTFGYPAYDDAGNLFVPANLKRVFRIAELPTGKSAFTLIKTPNVTGVVSKIQWVGRYLALELHYDSGGNAIDQIQISGRRGRVVSSTPILRAASAYFWIQDGSVVGLSSRIRLHNDQALAIWPYPSGGEPSDKFYGMTKGRKDRAYDVTVSIAPSR